jgi:hypothetical protein
MEVEMRMQLLADTRATAGKIVLGNPDIYPDALKDLENTRTGLTGRVRKMMKKKLRPKEWCLEKLDQINIISTEAKQVLQEMLRRGQQAQALREQCKALQEARELVALTHQLDRTSTFSTLQEAMEAIARSRQRLEALRLNPHLCVATVSVREAMDQLADSTQRIREWMDPALQKQEPRQAASPPPPWFKFDDSHRGYCGFRDNL